MTDARLPERWLNDRRLLKLSDAAYRLHVTGLMWSVANRTDGVLGDDDLPLLQRVDMGRTSELEKAALWDRQGDGWVIVDYAGTQTSASDLAVLENARRRDRENKAKRRAAAKNLPEDDPVPGTVPGNVTGINPGSAQDRPGQARPRQEELGPAVPCQSCSGPVDPDRVAAGWPDCGSCASSGDWPPLAAVPA